MKEDFPIEKKLNEQVSCLVWLGLIATGCYFLPFKLPPDIFESLAALYFLSLMICIVGIFISILCNCSEP